MAGNQSRRAAAAAAADCPKRSRLQSRAPASLQISPVSDWKMPIPLLSPLVTSPTAVERPIFASAAAAETRSAKEPRPDHHHLHHGQQLAEAGETEAAEKPPVFKMWQHPAAPFSYDPVPLRHSFVPV